MINNQKINKNNLFSLLLLLCISFSVITIVGAVAPDPGHDFNQSSGGLILGNIIYGSGTDTGAALAPNITTTKKFLSQTGNGSISAAPAWSTLLAADIPDISSTYSLKAGNTGLVTTGTLTSGTLGSGFTPVSDALISSASIWNAKMTNPMTTQGDIIYGGTGGASTRLAGSAGFLKSTGAVAPTWSSINLASDVGSSILPVANGGTGIAFFTVAGPASTAKTFTFPNANATVLTSNAAVTVAQGGTGLSATADDSVFVGDSSSAVTARSLPSCSNAATSKLLYDTTTNTFSCGTDQTGSSATPKQYNQSTGAQGAGFATDTYLNGSAIAIPASSLKVGSKYRLVFNVSKTAAGTAAPIVYVRFGTNASTADTARLTFTFNAGSAAADIGTFEIFVTFRTVGASTVMQGVARVQHSLSTTGLQTVPSKVVLGTSAAFDSTVANSKIGVSVNGGTGAVWTVQLVQAELENLQ